MKLADTTGAHRRPHLGSADASVPLGRPQPSRSPARSRRGVRSPAGSRATERSLPGTPASRSVGVPRASSMASKSGVNRTNSSRCAPLRSARIMWPSGESRKPTTRRSSESRSRQTSPAGSQRSMSSTAEWCRIRRQPATWRIVGPTGGRAPQSLWRDQERVVTVVAAPALRPLGGAHELEGESREERARIAIPAAALANATAAVTRAGRRRGGSRAASAHHGRGVDHVDADLQALEPTGKEHLDRAGRDVTGPQEPKGDLVTLRRSLDHRDGARSTTPP